MRDDQTISCCVIFEKHNVSTLGTRCSPLRESCSQERLVGVQWRMWSIRNVVMSLLLQWSTAMPEAVSSIVSQDK